MELITILALIFISGFTTLTLANKIGLPAIPSLILAGLIISPWLTPQNTSEIIVLGVSFLIFYIGLRTDLEGFRKVSSDSLNISLLQILLTFSLAYSLGYSIGFDILNSLYIALASSLASTLAGTDIFDKNLRMDLHHGQISTGSNFIQDLIAVLIITVLATGLTVQAFPNMVYTILLLSSAFIFRELFSEKAHKFIKTSELQVITMTAFFAASVGLAELTNMPIIAWVLSAGISLSKGSETEEILDTLEPLKDFFSIILFVGLGALITTPTSSVIQITAIIIFAVLVFRPLITSLIMLIDGHGGRKAFKTSVNMIQVSEFALAAVITAWLFGNIEAQILDAVVISVAVTMTVSTILTRHSDWFYERIDWIFEEIEEYLGNSLIQSKMEDHVVVIGFDVKGQKTVEYLQENSIDSLIVDYNIENIEKAKILGLEHIFGDALDDKTLEAANISEAQAIILTSTHKPVQQKIAGLNNINKIIMVEQNDKVAELDGENTEFLIDSSMAEKALIQKLQEAINENQT